MVILVISRMGRWNIIKSLRLVLIGIGVLFVALFIYILIDILTNGLLSKGAMKYISIIITITILVLCCDYIDRKFQKK